jgi:tetratricopeptide (TPR) repeat protein
MLPEKDRDPENGNELFNQGLKAEAAGRLPEAINLYEQSFRHLGSLKLLKSIGVLYTTKYISSQDVADLYKAKARLQQFLLDAPPNHEYRPFVIEKIAGIEVVLEAVLDPEEEVVLTQLVVLAPVDGALVQVDDEEPTELPIWKDVAPGDHRVRIMAEGYADHVETLTVPEGQSVQHDTELTPLPATLSVTGPDRARVTIDGEDRGQLPLPAFTLSPGPHTVAVVKNGQTAYAIEVDLGRAETRTLDAAPDMHRSTQRTASWALLGTGVAGMAAGTTLAMLALRDQNEAKTIGDKRDTVGISVAEDEHYDDLAQRRDTLRTWSIATGMTQYVREKRGPDGEKKPVLDLSWSPTPRGAVLRGAF